MDRARQIHVAFSTSSSIPHIALNFPSLCIFFPSFPASCFSPSSPPPPCSLLLLLFPRNTTGFSDISLPPLRLTLFYYSSLHGQSYGNLFISPPHVLFLQFPTPLSSTSLPEPHPPSFPLPPTLPLLPQKP